MGISCLFGHKWNGCTCARCGTVRDQAHDWRQVEGKCKQQCTVCGKVTDTPHRWKPVDNTLREVCLVCGDTRLHPDCVNRAVSLIRASGLPKRGDENWNRYREIGKQLNEFGGMGAMQQACLAVYQADSVLGRTVESIWSGIGEWMG